MPLNGGEEHWSTIEVDIGKLTISHFDSNQKPQFGGQSHEKLLAEYASKLSALFGVFQIIKESCVQQAPVGNTCGIHCIRNIEQLLNGKRVLTSFNPEKMRSRLIDQLEASMFVSQYFFLISM